MKRFNGRTLQKALEGASLELNVPIESIKYKVLEETKGLFKKSIEIEVYVENEKRSMDCIDSLAVELSKSPKETESGVELPEQASARNLHLEVSQDKLQAYLILKYTTGITYVITEQEQRVKKEIPPQAFTKEEVLHFLEEENIKYGIIHANIEKIVSSAQGGTILVAQGEKAIDDVPDKLHVHFGTGNTVDPLEEKGRVVYKDICSVDSVMPGKVLATLERGIEGRDGMNIYGQSLRARKAKKVVFKAGKGTEFKGENTIVASVSGKPVLKSGLFEINEVYEHRGDVGIESGSLKFQGNVKVFGSVKEGMKVEATGDVEVLGVVDFSKIYSGGNISLKGNVLRSRVEGGGKDNQKFELMRLYEKLRDDLTLLIATLEEIKKLNLLGKDKTDGQIIKALFESKFKSIPKVSLKILSSYKENQEGNELIESFIRTRILGLMPVTIKHYSEILKLSEFLSIGIRESKDNLRIPVSIFLNYCQDSEISSSGDVIFMGKGEYQSTVKASGGIYFQEGAVARGGSLISNKEIKCQVVGSSGGVITKLSVPKNGEIFVEKAFQNTLFSVGDKEKLLETSAKKVHAYLGKDGLIVIDSFKA